MKQRYPGTFRKTQFKKHIENINYAVFIILLWSHYYNKSYINVIVMQFLKNAYPGTINQPLSWELEIKPDIGQQNFFLSFYWFNLFQKAMGSFLNAIIRLRN